MNGTVNITIKLGPRHYKPIEEIAKTLGKSCEDTIIHILEYETGLRADPPCKLMPGKEAAV